MLAPEHTPTPAQMARWRAEAERRWPDYQLHLAFRQTQEGSQYCLWLSSHRSLTGRSLLPLLPTTPLWQPIELFWSGSTSYLEFLFEQFPDQASLLVSKTAVAACQGLAWLWLGIPATCAALALTIWRLGLPVPSVKFIPIPGITATATDPAQTTPPQGR